jgi:hypothetical protein
MLISGASADEEEAADEAGRLLRGLVPGVGPDRGAAWTGVDPSIGNPSKMIANAEITCTIV